MKQLITIVVLNAMLTVISSWFVVHNVRKHSIHPIYGKCHCWDACRKKLNSCEITNED